MIFLFFILSLNSYSSEETNVEQQTRAYIDEIINNNPSSQNKLSLRTGLIQIKGNTPGVALNSGDDTMPFVAAEWLARFNKHWGSEVRVLHGQNILYPAANDKNESDVFFRTIDVGLRYILEFDPLRKGNYFALKLFYHQTTNNFELETPNTDFLATGYSGPAFGVERGVTITSNIHLIASLDILYTLSVDEDSGLNVSDNGYSLFVRGEFNYLVNWFKRRGQVGLAYWQTSYSNEFDATSKIDSGRQNYVTTYRLLSLSYSLLF